MKSKQLIKFYFSAEALNGALDNLILTNAIKSGNEAGCGELFAERIIEIINVKSELARLWGYLDGIMRELTESERKVLLYYGAMRVGIKRLSAERAREIRRVTVKFKRRARAIDRYGEAVKLVARYYCVMRCG